MNLCQWINGNNHIQTTTSKPKTVRSEEIRKSIWIRKTNDQKIRAKPIYFYFNHFYHKHAKENGQEKCERN